MKNLSQNLRIVGPTFGEFGSLRVSWGHFGSSKIQACAPSFYFQGFFSKMGGKWRTRNHTWGHQAATGFPIRRRGHRAAPRSPIPATGATVPYFLRIGLIPNVLPIAEVFRTQARYCVKQKRTDLPQVPDTPVFPAHFHYGQDLVI